MTSFEQGKHLGHDSVSTDFSQKYIISFFLQPRPFIINDGRSIASLPVSSYAQQGRKEEIIDMSLDYGETANENEEAADVDQEEQKKPEVKRNFVYYFRHPYFRITTSYLVVFCNFLIFAEDPVSHSYTDCIIDIIGNMYAFVFSR